jgi:hypothetical protein
MAPVTVAIAAPPTLFEDRLLQVDPWRLIKVSAEVNF